MNHETDTNLKRRARTGIGTIGTVLVIYEAFVVPMAAGAPALAAHHLQHTILVLGGGLLAMALTARLPGDRRERAGWAWPAVLAPMAILALMWPSAYPYLTAHPGVHMLDHLGLAVCGFLTVLGAQIYARGLGWPTLVLLVGMCAATMGGYGISPGIQNILPPDAPVAEGQHGLTPESPHGAVTRATLATNAGSALVAGASQQHPRG